MLFLIGLGSRRVHLADCSANPDGRWTTQQARQLVWSLLDRPPPIRLLIRDRDSKFSRAFDDVFKSEGIEIIRTPFRAKRAYAGGERLRASRNETARSPMPVEPGGPNMADVELNEMFRSNPAAGCGSIARFE